MTLIDPNLIQTSTSFDRAVVEQAVLFLDLDGTARHCMDEAVPGFVNKIEDVVIMPEAREGMKAWRDNGGRIVAISNQAGVGKGYISEIMIARIMAETQKCADDMFDMILWCPHDPDTTPCRCRKPGIGMPLRAISELSRRYPYEVVARDLSLFVGDRPEDEECARGLGVRFVSAEDWRRGHSQLPLVR